MPDNAMPAAPAVTTEPTGNLNAGVMPGIEPEQKKVETVVDDPFEFDLDVKGKSQKIKFGNKDELKAVLQKALYADQVIKDATQAKKGAAELISKLKTPQGLREVLSDPDINVDIKKFALDTVREMMEDEQLTPEQRESRKYKTELEQLREEKRIREETETRRTQDEKNRAQAVQIRGEIIESMKKYPDIPQTQATMDAVIQNMRAAYKKFGKHLTAEQAMTVYSKQYWSSLTNLLDKMTPEQMLSRFGQKNLDKIQQLKLQELKNKTNPATQKPQGDPELKKKKHMTERDFDKHFRQLAGL